MTDYKKVARHLIKIADLYNQTDLTQKYWASRSFQAAAYKIKDLSSGFPLEDLKAVENVSPIIWVEVISFVKGGYDHLTRRFVDLSNRMADNRIPHELLEPMVTEVLEHLRGVGYTVHVAGSYRRKQSTSKNLDFVIIPTSRPTDDDELDYPARIQLQSCINHICGWRTKVSGPDKITGTISNVPVDFHLCEPGYLVPAMIFYTGPATSNVMMRTAAKKKGLKLTDRGLFNGSREVIPSATSFERDYYEALGMSSSHAHWLVSDPVIGSYTGKMFQDGDFHGGDIR